MDELKVAIQSLKEGKSGGPDGEFSEFIKVLVLNTQRTLLKLLNSTWKILNPS